MPEKTKETKKEEVKEETKKESPSKKSLKKKFKLSPLKLSPGILTLLVVMAIAVFFLGFKFKGLVLVARVNGQPIYSWQFTRNLWDKYSSQALEELILKQLVLQEAQEKQVTNTPEEVETEIEKIKTEIGGQALLDQYLQEQGISYSNFKEEVKYRLLIQKIIEKGITITEAEIAAFIRNYGAQLQATDAAAQKEEAKEALKSQKVLEAYNLFFTELRQKAQIENFLKP